MNIFDQLNELMFGGPPKKAPRARYEIVGERMERTGERIYNAADRGNRRRVKPPVRNWMMKKQFLPFGGFELLRVPRIITTVRFIDRNRCKRKAHNR